MGDLAIGGGGLEPGGEFEVVALEHIAAEAFGAVHGIGDGADVARLGGERGG